MAEKLTDRVKSLEKEIEALRSKIKKLEIGMEGKAKRPFSKVGGMDVKGNIGAVDIITGQGFRKGGGVIWNDAELRHPPYGTKPDDPTKGYNKHTHSKYAGGALDLSALELVEFDYDEDNYNIHCQGLQTEPSIKKDANGNEKISQLFRGEEEPDPEKRNIVWNEANKCWYFYAVYADIED